MPKPVQQPRLPLILGGKGGPRSLRLAAALADEYNTVMSTAAEIADIRKRLDQACEAAKRDPKSLPLSMMTGWLVGAEEAELRERASRLAQWKGEGEDGDAFLAGLRESTIKGNRAGDRAAARAGAAGLPAPWASNSSTATSTRSS